MSETDSEVDSIFSRLNCSGAHACYCERSTDGGCKTAITNLIAQEVNKARLIKPGEIIPFTTFKGKDYVELEWLTDRLTADKAQS